MARPRWQRLTIKAAKSTVTLVVLWAVGRHMLRTWNDLRDRSLSIHFEVGWLIVAGLLYLAGLLAYGCFYTKILRSSPTPVGLGPALRASLVSHLAKYVPGKAMVVVVRTALVVPFGARASTAAIAAFYETLVMMASGGLIAALGFAWAVGPGTVRFLMPLWGPVELPLYRLAAWSGLGLGLALLVVAIPAVFGRLARLASSPIPGVGPDAMPLFTMRLCFQGLVWSSCGWIMLGLSQLAVIRSFDPTTGIGLLAIGVVPVVIACVALATVSGFVVAVLPGGLGIREGVLMATLAPLFGSDQAVVASLTLRLVWMVAELAVTAVVFPWGRRPAKGGTHLQQSGSESA